LVPVEKNLSGCRYLKKPNEQPAEETAAVQNVQRGMLQQRASSATVLRALNGIFTPPPFNFSSLVQLGFDFCMTGMNIGDARKDHEQPTFKNGF